MPRRRSTLNDADAGGLFTPRPVHSFTFGTSPSFSTDEFSLPPNRLPKVVPQQLAPLQKAGSGRQGAVSNGFLGSSNNLRLRQSAEDQPQGSTRLSSLHRSSRLGKSVSSLTSQGSAPLAQSSETSPLSASPAQHASHLSHAGPLLRQQSDDRGSSGSLCSKSKSNPSPHPDEEYFGGWAQVGEGNWEAELAKAKEKAREEAARRKASAVAATAAEARPAQRQITKHERERVMAIIARSYLKSWLRSHGALVKPPKMHDNVRRVISAWFDLVDADGGGSLDSTELLSALKAAGIPCDDNTILEMISLMDLNSDGEISWEEFENFMCNEMAAGKTLLSGEYVLPSGTSLPFGAMVAKMKRNRMMEDIMEGGERRMKWVSLMNNTKALHDELNLFASAEVMQDEEHHQSEKEGRALIALAAMCESEREAAAIAAKVAKKKAESEHMEAEAAAAIIAAAEDRALAARLEADAARKTVEREAASRQRQQEEAPQEPLSPPPSPPISRRQQPNRSTSGLSGGPAAEAELLNKMCESQDATPRTFMTEPVLPPISPRNPTSPPEAHDPHPHESTSNTPLTHVTNHLLGALEGPTATEEPLAGLANLGGAGESSVADAPLSPTSRLGRLSVVVEGDIEGMLDSPVDSPSYGQASPKSRGGRSLKSQNSGRSTRTKGSEAMNTAGRAAAREAAREAAEREAALATTFPPADATSSAPPPANNTTADTAPAPTKDAAAVPAKPPSKSLPNNPSSLHAHPNPPLSPHMPPKPPSHPPFRHHQHQHQHQHQQQHLFQQILQHEQPPPLTLEHSHARMQPSPLNPDHSHARMQPPLLNADHSHARMQPPQLAPEHSHLRLPHELPAARASGSNFPGLHVPLSQMSASHRAGVHHAASIQAALTSRASLSSLPSEYTLPHEDMSTPRPSAGNPHGLAPVRPPPRMSDSTIPHSSPLRGPPERNRSLPGYNRAHTQGPPLRQASNSGSESGDHLLPSVPHPNPPTLPQLARTGQQPLAGALNSKQSSTPSRRLSQQSLTASLYAPKLPNQQP